MHHDGMKLWLDDERPAPVGWTWVKTTDEATAHLAAGGVAEASLDHDLGACDGCLSAGCSRCGCLCHRDGSWFVRWMAETNCWPRQKPVVHSANPVGAKYMRDVIDRYFEER